MKTDNAQIKEWFNSLDFDHNGFVDVHEWGRLLDSDMKIDTLFQVKSCFL